MRDAAQRPLREQLAEFISDLTARDRCKSHVLHTQYRLQRLIDECKWRLLREVSAEKFTVWLGKQTKLSAKTRNEYLGHANAFLNWAERQGRIERNPLKVVVKQQTKGRETFKRRALPLDAFNLLIERSGKRSLAYFIAGCTGLRRNEMKQLLWSDVQLDGRLPCINVRAETTKSKKSAEIPLVPTLAVALRNFKAKGVGHSGRVFPRGLPSVKTLAKDLKTCGITVEDDRGYRVDFHALRHTFASLLASVGVSELARVKLARHSEWRQTDRYTDPQSIPLFREMDKLANVLPSPIPSLKSGKTCPNLGNTVPSDDVSTMGKIVDFQSEKPALDNAVHDWGKLDNGARGGTRTPMRLSTGF